MTLKEKLCEPFGGLKTETVNELEQIADEFAIDFAEWCDENYFRIGSTSFWAESLFDEKAIAYKTEELLEIYKKTL